MKKLLLLMVGLSFLNCGQMGRVTATFTGYSTECIEGVKYVQLTSGASVMYNKDGSIKACD